jgi:hypothetical protein
VTYVLPPIEWGRAWEIAADTAGASDQKRDHVEASGTINVEARSLVICRRVLL